MYLQLSFFFKIDIDKLGYSIQLLEYSSTRVLEYRY